MHPKVLKAPPSRGKGGVKLSEEQIQEIVPGLAMLYLQGWPEEGVPLTLRQIAELVNRGRESVRGYLLNAGVKLRRRGRRPTSTFEIEMFSDEYYLTHMDEEQLFKAVQILRTVRRANMEGI